MERELEREERGRERREVREREREFGELEREGSEDLRGERDGGLSRWEECAGNRQRREEEKGKD